MLNQLNKTLWRERSEKGMWPLTLLIVAIAIICAACLIWGQPNWPMAAIFWLTPVAARTMILHQMRTVDKLWREIKTI